jgi:hypothetical protein
VLLEQVENGGLKMLATPTFLVNGNLSVRVKRASGEAFVFKKDAIEATPERLRELEAFRAEVVGMLEMLEMTGRA